MIWTMKTVIINNNHSDVCNRLCWDRDVCNTNCNVFTGGGSCVVRTFAHGVMGRRIDTSWWTYSAISRSSQCSSTGVTKAVVCDIMSVG